VYVLKKGLHVFQQALITWTMNGKNKATLYEAGKFWSSLTGINKKS
jgi:hypothetical protein